MRLLREPLLATARSDRLRGIAERSRLTRPVVNRFVAGDTEADALRTVTHLVDSRLLVTLDHLGENGFFHLDTIGLRGCTSCS
jgi:proline dehydrogenase